MVVTSNGRPVAILSSITESSMEQSLAFMRQARAAAAVAALQRRSMERGADGIGMDEVDAEIASVRNRS